MRPNPLIPTFTAILEILLPLSRTRVPFLGLDLLRLWDKVSPVGIHSVKRADKYAEIRGTFYETALLLVT
jgi:hypothetical protein